MYYMKHNTNVISKSKLYKNKYVIDRPTKKDLTSLCRPTQGNVFVHQKLDQIGLYPSMNNLIMSKM